MTLTLGTLQGPQAPLLLGFGLPLAGVDAAGRLEGVPVDWSGTTGPGDPLAHQRDTHPEAVREFALGAPVARREPILQAIAPFRLNLVSGHG